MNRRDRHIWALRRMNIRCFLAEALRRFSSDNINRHQEEFEEALRRLRPYFNSTSLVEEKFDKWDICTKLPTTTTQ